MRRSLALAGLASSFWVSCSAAPLSSLEWSLRFANPDTAARAAFVVTTIRKNSCSSGSIVYEATLRRGESAPATPSLPAGTYALSGRAVSATCQTIAYGCVQTLLPQRSNAPIEVLLDDTPPLVSCEDACADPSACEDVTFDDAGASRDGGTTPPEGGVGDGGREPDDGGPATGDAGGDAGNPNDGGGDCDGTVGPNGHCYRFVAAPTTWALAETDCITWGGHLVSLNDADEELWVSTEAQAQLKDGSQTLSYWIGFRDSVERFWKWSDGSGAAIIVFSLDDPQATRYRVTDPSGTERATYTHWGPNPPATGNSEPNNGAGADPNNNDPGEDCAHVRDDRISGPGGITPRPEWDDSTCTDPRRAVCERE